jgi:hypothetical protein
MSDFDTVIDLIVGDSMLESGMNPNVIASRSERIRAIPKSGKITRTKWSLEEKEFLRANIAIMTEGEISAHLGRSLNAIHVHIVRYGIPRKSRQPGYMTGNQVAKLLSIDGHKITGWIESNILPGKRLPGERKITVVEFDVLKRWLVRPENWPYFDSRKIKNEYLRRLIGKAKIRWGDEWWTTRHVANYHNCDIQAVNLAIQNKKLPSIKCKNIGGRGKSTWVFGFVKRSDAISWCVPKHEDSKFPWTERSDQFILKSREKGIHYQDIARMMHWPQKRVEYRYHTLIKEGNHGETDTQGNT